MNCPHCKNIFINKYSLNTHLKNAKYCLKLRNKTSTNFTCTYCDKNLSSREWLKSHEQKCKEKTDEKNSIEKAEKDSIEKVKNSEKLKNENEDLKSENICLLNEIEHLKYELRDNKERLTQKDLDIKELQNKLENITIKAISRPTTTTNNNVRNNVRNNIQAFIQNAQQITPEFLQSHVANLRKEHIDKGVAGYVDYAMSHPFKDNIKCSDFSRKKLHYKDGDNNIITDYNLNKLAPMLFSSVVGRTRELTEEMGDVNNLTSETFDRMVELHNTLSDVKTAGRGETTDFSNEFNRRICSASLVQS